MSEAREGARRVSGVMARRCTGLGEPTAAIDIREAMDVLVVDDNIDIRLPLAEVLREEGYSVAELSSGPGLVDTVAAMRPALVLLDLTMPGFDPADAIGRLRGMGLLEWTSIVALSGMDDAAEIAEELELSGAVKKPFSLDELLTTVARFARPTGSADDDSSRPSV